MTLTGKQPILQQHIRSTVSQLTRALLELKRKQQWVEMSKWKFTSTVYPSFYSILRCVIVGTVQQDVFVQLSPKP
jgi:hypothetical protein